MNIPTMMLTAVLALGSGLSGNALAHGDPGRGWGHGGHDRHQVHRHRGHHRHERRHVKRHWRRHHRADHYDYRPRYRPHDSWYGIHLFFGGH